MIKFNLKKAALIEMVLIILIIMRFIWNYKAFCKTLSFGMETRNHVERLES